MPSFYNLTSGVTAQAQDVQQIIDALKGTAGLGVPLSPTAVSDQVNYALAVKNLDTNNSRALQVIKANNTVLLQADTNGLIGSVDGSATVAQIVNVSATQTLANKTLSVPVLTGPTILSAGYLVLNGTVPNDIAVDIQATINSSAGQADGVWVRPTVNASNSSDSLFGIQVGAVMNPNSHTSNPMYLIGVTGTFDAAPGNNSGENAGIHVNPVYAVNNQNNYGIKVETVVSTGGPASNIGVFVAAPSGATSNIGLVVGSAPSTFNGAIFAQSADSVFGTPNVANTATSGFLFVPQGGGSPTGVPTWAGNGWAAVRYDTSTHKLWVYDSGSSSWKGALFS